jgi:hypothetical protein
LDTRRVLSPEDRALDEGRDNAKRDIPLEAIFTYPESKYVGKHVGKLPGYSEVCEHLKKLGDGVLIETIEVDGAEHIGFFGLLENGWSLRIVAPVQYYYSEVRRMIPVIAFLSVTLALALCFILIRLSAAKTRSEEESRAKSSFLAA